MTDQTDSPPYLYILMRTDMASMNPGKAVAQGAHAANQCIEAAQSRGPAEARLLVEEWQGQTGQGFGVTITLGVNGWELAKRIETAKASGLHAGVTHDPTYPIRDGEVTHLIPLDTCGFILGRKLDCALILEGLDLMA